MNEVLYSVATITFVVGGTWAAIKFLQWWEARNNEKRKAYVLNLVLLGRVCCVQEHKRLQLEMNKGGSKADGYFVQIQDVNKAIDVIDKAAQDLD
jgi:prolyl oligopeptidase PreP (S9A serine peptidase family)